MIDINITCTIVTGIVGIVASYIFYKKGRKSLAEELSPNLVTSIATSLARAKDSVFGCDEEILKKWINKNLTEASIIGKPFNETNKYISDFHTKFSEFFTNHQSSPYSGYNYQHFVSDSPFNSKDPDKNEWEKLREEFKKGLKKYLMRDLLNR